MDQSMERAWISAGGAGLVALKHSWVGGGDRNFPVHGGGDFSQLSFPGTLAEPCARWGWFQACG